MCFVSFEKIIHELYKKATNFLLKCHFSVGTWHNTPYRWAFVCYTFLSIYTLQVDIFTNIGVYPYKICFSFLTYSKKNIIIL